MANVRIKYNRSLKMSPGKLAAQAVHAALRAYGIDHGSVVVLEGTATQVRQMDVQIQDAGLTEVAPGSLTAGASLEPLAPFDDYHEFMSCCRSATEHETHSDRRVEEAKKLLEYKGYIIVKDF